MNHTLNHYKNYSKVQHNTNKFHDITHYPNKIKYLGAPIYGACYSEDSYHRTVCKIPFASCSNMRDPIPQLIKQIQIRNIINEESSNFLTTEVHKTTKIIEYPYFQCVIQEKITLNKSNTHKFLKEQIDQLDLKSYIVYSTVILFENLKVHARSQYYGASKFTNVQLVYNGETEYCKLQKIISIRNIITKKI